MSVEKNTSGIKVFNVFYKTDENNAKNKDILSKSIKELECLRKNIEDDLDDTIYVAREAVINSASYCLNFGDEIPDYMMEALVNALSYTIVKKPFTKNEGEENYSVSLKIEEFPIKTLEIKATFLYDADKDEYNKTNLKNFDVELNMIKFFEYICKFAIDLALGIREETPEAK